MMMANNVMWDAKDYQVRTRSVQEQLEPLIRQVTTLVNHEQVRRKGRGKSKKAAVLLKILEKAIQSFLQQGTQVAEENPQMEEKMLQAVEEVRVTGAAMLQASQTFTSSPFDSTHRAAMVAAARSLLRAVTHLLILADMLDVQLLLNSIDTVKLSLDQLKTTPDNEFNQHLQRYIAASNNLHHQAGIYQREILDQQMRDDIAAARAILKKNTVMLMTASKTYLSHPEVAAARANKDQVIRDICEAVDIMGDVAKGKRANLGAEPTGALGRNLEALQSKVVKDRDLLEKQVEELLNGAMKIYDSGLRDERKTKLTASCNAVKEALQTLLSESLRSPPSEQSLQNISQKTRDLHRQLRKAIADRVAATFSNDPLESLANAAQRAQVQEVETCAALFTEHCNKLVEVSNQVALMSTNEDGIKLVRLAASQLYALCPEVINAARILAVHPESSAAKESLQAFAVSWQNQVKLLLEAVDDITTIDEVLSVLDNQMYEDVNGYIAALKSRNPDLLRSIAEDIRNRAERISSLVSAEMDNYEPCLYTKQVMEAIRILNKDLDTFESKSEEAVKVLQTDDGVIEENEFIDATRLIYDGVRDVRRAVLMNRADEDLDPEEVEYEEEIRNELVQEEVEEDLSGITVVRQAMQNMTEADKTKIMQQVENFESEKSVFDREVSKWDEASNDIVVLAKQMCVIMMNMTDFVRQKGPLKTSSDVIAAAKRISELGLKLNKIGNSIAELYPDSDTKKDLLAYLERVTLYGHQINIIAKVKADVEHSSNQELLVAGIESATSLIENAKNLMNAVVLTVKASYVASTRYSKGQVGSFVVWKMKVPEKKPLIRREAPKEVRAVVRRGSQRKPQNPIKVLSEFQI